jgi:hypothetical protein
MAPETHVECSASPMSGMSRLESADKVTKLRFVKPVGNQPSQATLALGNVIVTISMQRMAGIRGCPLSSHHENQPISPGARLDKKALQLPPGLSGGRAVKVKLCFIGDETAGKLL